MARKMWKKKTDGTQMSIDTALYSLDRYWQQKHEKFERVQCRGEVANKKCGLGAGDWTEEEDGVVVVVKFRYFNPAETT
jgi:hypothetical protein